MKRRGLVIGREQFAYLAIVLTLSLLSAANAATITITLGGVSPQLQCNQTWTNQNVILRFTETIASEDGSGGYCSFGIGPGFVWLYPCRLALDFTLLERGVTKVEAVIHDQCGVGCTKLFAYSGASQIGAVGNTAAQGQTLLLNFDVSRPDRCAIRSFEAMVNEIRIFIEDSTPPRLAVEADGGSVAVSWPTNAIPYLLEKTDSLTGLPDWTPQTNNIQVEGSNFVHRIASPAGTQFFRLRRD
jgi:hypothetical protein